MFIKISISSKLHRVVSLCEYSLLHVSMAVFVFDVSKNQPKVFMIVSFTILCNVNTRVYQQVFRESQKKNINKIANLSGEISL